MKVKTKQQKGITLIALIITIVVLMILAAALQQFHHGYDLNKVYDLYDEFVEEGNTMIELIPVIIDVLSVSGYIKMDAKKEE